MNPTVRTGLLLVACSGLVVALSTGCTTRSFPGTYRGNLDLGGVSLPLDKTIGVARFKDMRPQANLGTDPSKSYIANMGVVKIGLTYNSRAYMPVDELLHDILISELTKLGATARRLDTGAPIVDERSLQAAGRSARVDYALGGQIMAFEFGASSGMWTVDGFQTVTLSVTMVKVNGPTLFANKLFTDSHRENEGMGVLHTTLIDKLLNIALKNTLRRLVQEMCLATSDQATKANVSVVEQDIPIGRKVYATIDLPPASWRPLTIAVANIEGLGLSQEEALVLAENVRSALVETEYFQVISRADMEKLLKEQQFQRTDACDDTQCLIEMGKALAAQKIVGGSAGKAGGVYNITLRMVDVESGKIEFTTYEDIENAKDLLPAARDLGRKLASRYGESRTKKSTVP